MREIIAPLLTSVLITAMVVTGFVYYKSVEIKAMQSNIESAIVKGIDPIAVKCAYNGDDATCIAYALRKSPDVIMTTPAKNNK